MDFYTGDYCVYMHVNKINKKKYIGITKTPTSKRWGHNGQNYKSNKQDKFYRAIQKYGWDNFEHVVISEHLTQEEACQKEIDLIAQYHTQDDEYGYNIQPGGQLGNTGVVFTEEHKKKLSDAHKGKKLSEEHKIKISNGCKGHRPSIHTEEFIQRQRMLNTGKVMSDKTRKRISQTLTGIKRSPETIQKRKLNNPLLVCVYCPELDMQFPTISDAAQYTNTYRSNIQKCLKGQRNSAGKHPATGKKLHWIKVEK